MKRPRNIWQELWYLAQAVPAFAVYGVMRALPLSVTAPACASVLRTIGPLLPVSSVARENLRLAYPEKSAAERARILRGVWDNLGRLAGEYMHLDDLWDDGLFDASDRVGLKRLIEMAERGEPARLATDRLEVIGAENFIRLLIGEGPALMFAPHVANFELLPFGAGKFGVYTAVVFRTPNNPYVARLIHRIRSGLGDLLPKGLEGAVAAARVLEEGGRVGMLVDQKHNRGIPVPFFGRPAMTAPTVAKLALRYNAPIYGACVHRTGPGRFRITVTPPLKLPTEGDEDAKVARIMAEINATCEAWVREAPEQWLWLHRRWPKKTA